MLGLDHYLGRVPGYQSQLEGVVERVVCRRWVEHVRYGNTIGLRKAVLDFTL